jgi:FkbM family methyltransferase
MFCWGIKKKMNLVTAKWRWFTIVKIEGDNIAIYINEDLMLFLKSINIKGKEVIDGGCSIGIYALYFSIMIGKAGVVHAFELQHEIAQLAITNAELNKKENIRVYNSALSNVSGELVGFTYINYNEQSISSVGVKTEQSLKGSPHCGNVETVAIDALKLNNVGLIKLDIEGHEPQALGGMWETIDRCKPYLVVELSPVYLENKQQETIDKIMSHGYSVKELSDFNYVFEPT